MFVQRGWTALMIASNAGNTRIANMILQATEAESDLQNHVRAIYEYVIYILCKQMVTPQSNSNMTLFLVMFSGIAIAYVQGYIKVR